MSISRSATDASVLDVNEILKVELNNDNVQSFKTRWDEQLDEQFLGHLYYRQPQQSQQQTNCFLRQEKVRQERRTSRLPSPTKYACDFWHARTRVHPFIKLGIACAGINVNFSK